MKKRTTLSLLTLVPCVGKTVCIGLVVVAVSCITGCQHIRTTEAADVNDHGPLVKTRYKYSIVGIVKDDVNDLWLYAWSARKGDEPAKVQTSQPDVFAVGGIPIVVKHVNVTNHSDGFAKMIPIILTFGILPGFETTESKNSLAICLINDDIDPEPVGTVSHVRRIDSAASLLPWPVLCYKSDIKIKGLEDKRTFRRDSVSWIDENGMLNSECLDYAIATKLKELEEAGVIDDNVAARAERIWARRRSKAKEPTREPASKGKPGRPPYRIVKCERDRANDFSYSFELKPEENIKDKKGFERVLNSFADSVREMYADTFPGVKAASLKVDFPRTSMENGNLTGRAVVLSVMPKLTYDHVSRKGTISVRVRADQRAEARSWLRRTIEVIAQDKNIALGSGTTLPKGRYRIIRENPSKDTIEIEFVVE